MTLATEAAPAVPRGRWSILIILSAVSFLLLGGPLVSLSVYMPVLKSAEGWSEAALGGTATALLICVSVASLTSGALSDRIGPRWVILAGSILAAIGCLLAARAAAPSAFMNAYILIGLGIGLATTVPSISILNRSFGVRRGLALGLYFAALALASAVLPPVSAALISHSGWRAAYIVMSCAIAMAAPLVLMIRSSLPAAAPPEDNATGTRTSIGASLRSLPFWILLGGMTLALVNAQGVLFSTVAFLVRGGMSLDSATAIYSFANFCAVPAMVIVGIVADRFGAQPVLVSATILQGLGTVALLGIGQAAPLTWFSTSAFCLAWGMTCAVPNQLGPVILEDLVGSYHFGVLLGINTAITGFLSALSPLGSAFLRDQGYRSSSIFLGYAFLCGLAALLLALARARRTMTEPA